MKTGQTVILDNKVYINSTYASVGALEGRGPLGSYFDNISEDASFGAKSWEQAENALVKRTVSGLLTKASLTSNDVDYIFAGDLLNQCTGTSFGLCDYDISFYGLYGACSTFAEGLGLGALMVNAGYAERIVALASSHFCSSEKQYRFPLEYGGVRTPTSQWTVTGSGGAVLSSRGSGMMITSVTTGKMVNKGVCDANNMGAAMAPAAADTIEAVLRDTNTQPEDYDLILTGDLGILGKEIMLNLMKQNGHDITHVYNDCGCMIFYPEQTAPMGASGCGCAATVFNGAVLKELKTGKIKNVVLAATGAMLSPISSFQGESIPGISYAINFRRE